MKNRNNNKSILGFILSAIITLTWLPIVDAKTQTQAGFNLPKLSGGTVSAESLRGKVVVLAVAASWLPLSQDQAKGINRLVTTYTPKNVEFFWVFTDSGNAKSKNYASDADLLNFAKTNSLRINLLRDSDGVEMKKLGVSQVPAFVILDKSGSKFGTLIEGIDPETNSTAKIEKGIDDALKN